MAGETIEAIQGILDHRYTADEALLWLRSGHPQLGDRRPIDMLVDGREDDVLAVLRSLDEGTYL